MSKDLTLQVLAVTTNNTDRSLPEKMNLQCDALIGNQCDRLDTEEFEYNGHSVTMYSWPERGVGLNRNSLMMRASADIVLFADDDVVYDDGYAQKVINAFELHPEADVIFFNVIPIPETIDPCRNVKWRRIHLHNCLKYGAPRMAVRTSRLRETNVYYTLLFGGGAKYSSGEDSLFIADCIRRGLKSYAAPIDIGHVTFETSTWYNGFNEKYFMDKGLFFYFFSHRFYKFLCLQYCIRRQGLFKSECSAKEAYRLMKKGVKLFKSGEY